MAENSWLRGTTSAFRLAMATSWLAPACWQEKQEKAVREAIGGGLDWTEYLSLVERHRIPALSWAALKRVAGLEVPEPVRQELQRRSDKCRMQAVRHCMLLAEVLKGLSAVEIPAMPFKGQMLSWELYGDVGLRQSRDLDLAVPRDDLARAQACLENMGWRLDSSFFPLSPRQWESFLRHEHHLDFIHSKADCMLEMHWHNQWDTPALTSARWARSIPTLWQGCSLQAMNPIDQVLYLCSHGGDHGWFRAKWLGDLARAHAAGKVDWVATLVEARKTGQERALLVGLGLLDKVYGLPLPELPGDTWMNLPPLLIEMSLRALKYPGEPPTPNSPASFRNRLRMNRFERLLRPRKRWRDSLSQLAYCRENFKDIRLPDRFFWAFVPLRPFLWAWRWLRQPGRRITGD